MAPMNSHKIVVYSSSSSQATLIASILSPLPARIVYCCSPQQTIASCRQEMPRIVIILDIAPFIDGSNLLAGILSAASLRPAVYVVAWHQSEQIVLSLLECGIDQYMTFPICMNRLKMKVEAQLNSAR